MRFALLGKCFAVGERVERMETLEFEEVRIYRINVSGRNCEPRPLSVWDISKGWVC